MGSGYYNVMAQFQKRYPKAEVISITLYRKGQGKNDRINGSRF